MPKIVQFQTTTNNSESWDQILLDDGRMMFRASTVGAKWVDITGDIPPKIGYFARLINWLRTH